MEKKRRLFCELGPVAFRISVWKCGAVRHARDLCSGTRFAREKRALALPVLAAEHRSIIRRALAGVDVRLQENKAANLALAAPHIHGIVVRPGETFSFWGLVGPVTTRRGYREGLVIRNGRPESGIGGGMCQLTNMLHWLVLHTPLTVTERHHHDGFDLFPDCGRQLPFGVGTSIFHPHVDYRFYNRTEMTYQLLLRIEDGYLRGELRAERELPVKYHITALNEHFTLENGIYYRNGTVERRCVEKRTGSVLTREILQQNHARLLYEPTEEILRAIAQNR